MWRVRPGWRPCAGHEHDAPVAPRFRPGLLDLGQWHRVDVDADLAGGDQLEQVTIGGRCIGEAGWPPDAAAEQLDGGGAQGDGGQGRNLTGRDPDLDVTDPLGAIARPQLRAGQRGEDRLCRRAPQVVDDQVVGPLGGDRLGKLLARAIDPDGGVRSAGQEVDEDLLIASGGDDARAVALGQLGGDPAGGAGRAEHEHRLAAALPNGRLAVLPGTHALPVENPEVVNALLLWFLAGAAPAADWSAPSPGR